MLLLMLELLGSLPILFRDFDSVRFVRVLENKWVRLDASALLLGVGGFVGGVGGVEDSSNPGFDFLREKILRPVPEVFLLRVAVLSAFAGTGGPMGSVGGGDIGGEVGKSVLYRAYICSCKRMSQSAGAISMHRVCAMKLQS